MPSIEHLGLVQARGPKEGEYMHIASFPTAWAAMTVEELEDALREAVIKSTEAENSEHNAMLALIDEYFATCLEPEDEADRRRDLMVLLSSLLERQALVSC